MRWIQLEAAVVVVIAAATCGVAKGQQTNTSTQDILVGRAWEGTSEGHPVVVEFRPGGVLYYLDYSSSSPPSTGTWVKKGRIVTFEMHDRFVEFEGTVDGKTIKGAAHNRNGQKWTWSVSTDPDFVVLPQDVHCLLHDTQTTFGFGKNGEMKVQLSAIKAITCRINGPEKDVPLIGIQPDGTVLTKDFGRLKITNRNQMDPGTFRASIILERIEIQIGKLKSFIEFLKGK
jgi:hypothetical protein